MALSNLDRVNKGLELLRSGLFPYIVRELKEVNKAYWQEAAVSSFPEDHHSRDLNHEEWDVQALLLIMWKNWNGTFNKTLGFAERSMVSELMEVRKRSAHQNKHNKFDTDDAYRALDNIERLLSAIAAPEAEEAQEQKSELLRIRYEENTRKKARKIETQLVDVSGAIGLKPWKQIITPHPDVASGKFQQAEFAADLWRVYQDGEGAGEYGRPVDFFNRTYLTQGIQRLLTNAIERLNSDGGDPVINLQTNFGGGKTHSLLALYHLCSGADFTSVRDLEDFFNELGDKRPPKNVNRAVLVGNRISPNVRNNKTDSVTVKTLWGEMAWQLAGKEGYEIIREADERAANPGDSLVQLFKKAAPCMVLIDEWVAYTRQLKDDSDDLSGTYGTQMSFAQALCEAAKAVPNALVVISLPASDIEMGGAKGRQSAAELGNIVGRIESPWMAATTEESFEIVTRRLFSPISTKEQYAERDATARSFGDFYRQNNADFPNETQENSYEKRIRDFFPIHPELFDGLAERWASIPQFQKTRGILRLMAKIIHSLWENNDQSPLILPANVPMDAADIQNELMRYLEEPWRAVIQKDVDGSNAVPRQIDNDFPNIGRFSATRRVARTLFFGSAPTFNAANRGIDEQKIKLGSILPGENIPTFTDALRHLTDKATYVYHQSKNYWYSTQNNVNRTAEERAAHIKVDRVEQEIVNLLSKQLIPNQGQLSRIHLMPQSSNDIPDDFEMKLIVIGIDNPHIPRDENSPALVKAKEILLTKGKSQRLYRNTLLFLSADRSRLEELKKAVQLYLAWKSIVDDKTALNLDAYQSNQAESKTKASLDTIKLRLPETFIWILTSFQERGSSDIVWDVSKMNGSNQEPYLSRVLKKLTSQSLLYNDFAPTLLKMDLDNIPLWRDNSVEIKQLREDYAKYLYLAKLSSPTLLEQAIENGLALVSWKKDSFALADSYDAENLRYLGLQAGTSVMVSLDSSRLLVKADIASTQIEKDKEEAEVENASTGYGKTTKPYGGETELPTVSEPSANTKKTRFFGHIETDATRFFRAADDVEKEILRHLDGIKGSDVKITIHIEASTEVGFENDVERTLKENGRTLGFGSVEFE
ncbi:Swt1 family HEPN domain-containing protein [Cyclobacterium jeungdonense]|uniref:Swt1 family HEPN domain-containing protein n=1 Tax=Cyclobacterium jeungdonense TaxID=708087 RepID=A0ABT8C3F1_9BACT|nr:Swt1 family HEPN domain-containing protein [Cyclobacterium jeungdonense]MDN3687236.1 Swt1 family HEPN domain-containing protein [Cyclobacterium jeungdonense]